MEGLYSKLYEKYSNLKAAKDSKLDQISEDQEVKFFNYMSEAEELINKLEEEKERLFTNVYELRKEVISVRTAKDEQIYEFQERLREEKWKNQQLSAEVEHLRSLQQERMCSSNRSDQPEKQHVNSKKRSPPVSRTGIDESPMRMTRKRARVLEETSPPTSPAAGHIQLSARKVSSTNESPMRMTRKRARLFDETGPPTSSAAVGHIQLSAREESSTDQSKGGVSMPNCCLDYGGLCKCMFQDLLECLIGMKFSVADKPEGKSTLVVHQSSGLSFSLMPVINSTSNERELLYNKTSLGTFANVAPEWMREEIKFSLSMCPIFFERLSRIIKPC